MYRIPAALLVILAVAGCSSAAGVGHLAALSKTPSSQISSSATSPSAVPSTSAKQANTPVAADGANVAACRDDNCQIAVSHPVSIPLDGRAGITELSIDKITNQQIGMHAASAGGIASSETGPGCVLTFGPHGGSSFCGNHPTPLGGGLIVRILTISHGIAILELSMN